MKAQKTYQLLRTDILLGTDLNCYNSLISLDHKMKIMREKKVPFCSKCQKLINFILDCYLDNSTDEYTCSKCYSITDFKTTTKFYGSNLHLHDYIK